MQVLLYASLMASRNIPEHILQSLVFGHGFTYQYHLSVSTLTSHALVDVLESNEARLLFAHAPTSSINTARTSLARTRGTVLQAK